MMSNTTTLNMIEGKIRSRFPLYPDVKRYESGSTEYALTLVDDCVWMRFGTVLHPQCPKCVRHVEPYVWDNSASSRQIFEKQCELGHISKTLLSKPILLKQIDQLQGVLDDWEKQLIGFIGEKRLRKLREQQNNSQKHN